MLINELANEWVKYGISVNATGPSYFASNASSFTTGQLLNVDGGWTAI